MRHERLIAMLLAASLVAGCKSVDDWSGLKRRGDTTPVSQTDDGQIVADYLATLDRLGRGGAAKQAEILEATRNAYLADPSTRKRLRYAFVLAVPGHAASDPAGARSLLGEALATPETMLPSERALADLMVRDLDARLALAHENETLRSGSNLPPEDIALPISTAGCSSRPPRRTGCAASSSAPRRSSRRSRRSKAAPEPRP